MTLPQLLSCWWFMLQLKCSWLLINYVYTTSYLNVVLIHTYQVTYCSRCEVFIANTRKIANWMMCCIVINTEVLLATYVPGCNAAVEKNLVASKPWVFTFVQRGASDNVFSTGLWASCIAAGMQYFTLCHYGIMHKCEEELGQLLYWHCLWTSCTVQTQGNKVYLNRYWRDNCHCER